MKKYICLTDKFAKFTLGKIYEGSQSPRSTYIEITNDEGGLSYPSKFGYDGPNNFVEYFVDLDEWRSRQLNRIFN